MKYPGKSPTWKLMSKLAETLAHLILIFVSFASLYGDVYDFML